MAVRKYAARIWTRLELNDVVKLLGREVGQSFRLCKSDQMVFDVSAPDGDKVIKAAQIRPGIYAVLLHREVFDV